MTSSRIDVPTALALASLLGLGFALATPHARAAQSYDSCSGFITSIPAIITTQGTWCLDRDLSTTISVGAAISIDTNNVTIDCNQFKLGGLGAGPTTLAAGIVASSRLNATVRNCNIRGFREGVSLNGSGHVVEDNRFEANVRHGIHLLGDGNLVRRNVVRDTGDGPDVGTVVGIRTSGGVDILENLVQGVTGSNNVASTTYGIWQSGGQGSRVAGNTVRDITPTNGGDAAGIYTSNGQKALLDDNRVVLHTAVAGSVAFRCNANEGSLRGNTAWGFQNLSNGSCFNDGGNVHR